MEQEKTKVEEDKNAEIRQLREAKDDEVRKLRESREEELQRLREAKESEVRKYKEEVDMMKARAGKSAALVDQVRGLVLAVVVGVEW